MPRFNPYTAEAVMGVGNGPLSVDGRLLRHDGGGPSVWLNADQVLHQIGDQLATTNVRTGVSAIVGPGVNEASSGANGQYLAWSVASGLFGAIVAPEGGLNRVITDGRGTNPPDGCQVYIPNRQSDAAPTIVRHPNGTEAHLPGAYGMHVLRWEQACWNAGPGVLGFWGQSCEHLPGAAYAKLAELRGELWLTYFLDGVGLIAHRGQSPDVYYVLTTSDQCFHHDAMVWDGRLAVCFSVTTGEGPDHLVKCMDVESMSTRPYEKPSKPSPIPVEQVEPLAGKWVMAWYEQRGAPESLQPPQPLPPGNMEIAVRTANYPPGTVRPRPVITMMDGYDRISPAYLVRLGSEGDHSAEGLRKIEQLAWNLFEEGIQSQVYWDDRNPPYWPDLPKDCIWEQVAYCEAKEDLAHFEAFLDNRAYQVFERYKYLMFAAQTHTTNSALLAEPSQAIPPLRRVLGRHRQEFGERMVGLSVFNNSGRDDAATGEGGLTAPNNQDLRPHWERLFSGVTGLPNVFTHVDGGGGGNGGNGGVVHIEIFDFPSRVNRSDRKGLLIAFDITSDRPIIKIELGLVDANGSKVETALMPKFDPPEKDDDKDGRYVRQLAWKPVRNGVFHPYVIAWDDSNGKGEFRSPNTVEVYS